MLTREQILSASPAQINEWIDQYIMQDRDRWLPPENWSGDISAAWEVAEKFETLEVKKFITDKGMWFCEIKTKVWHRSYGETAPLAICRAALLSIQGEE